MFPLHYVFIPLFLLSLSSSSSPPSSSPSLPSFIINNNYIIIIIIVIIITIIIVIIIITDLLNPQGRHLMLSEPSSNFLSSCQVSCPRKLAHCPCLARWRQQAATHPKSWCRAQCEYYPTGMKTRMQSQGVELYPTNQQKTREIILI